MCLLIPFGNQAFDGNTNQAFRPGVSDCPVMAGSAIRAVPHRVARAAHPAAAHERAAA